MSFLNASLIFGTLAVAVPIVLHLIARKEPRRVVFPSVRLLTQRFETNRSRLRVRRWWLLALRILAIAAMAIALARPAIHRSLSITWLTIGLIAVFGVGLLVMATVAISKGQSRSAILALASVAVAAIAVAATWGGITAFSGTRPSMDNSSPVAVVILLDNSPTSDWRTGEGSRIEEMKAAANELIQNVPPTSRIAILDRSATPAAFSLDVASAISKVTQLKPIETPQPVQSRLDAARRLLETSELSTRHVVLISDLAESTYLSGDGVSEQKQTIEKPFGDESAIGLSILDLGELEGVNRSVSIPFIPDETPPAGSVVPITTTVSISETRSGEITEDPKQSVTVELRLFENRASLPVVRNGSVVRPKSQAVDQQFIDISPGQPVEVTLNIPALQPGQHHGFIHLVGDDALPLDNAGYFTLNVLPPVRLLIVGDIEEERMDLAGMVTATTNASGGNSEFAVETVSFDSLGIIRLNEFPGLMLLDPPRDVLADEALSDYVAGGGNIFVCLGDAAGNEPLSLDWAPDLLRRWRVPEPGSFFQSVSVSHPTIEKFADVQGGVPWADYRVTQYWQIERRNQDSVIMNYVGTDHPALLETATAGPNGGRWLILTTPVPNTAKRFGSWNELLSADEYWPAFYLIRFIAQHLCGRTDTRAQVSVGSPVSLTVSLNRPAEQSRQTVRMQMFPPGDSVPVPIEVAVDSEKLDEAESTTPGASESTPQQESKVAAQVVVGDTPHSGTYWIRGGGENVGFSVNIPRERLFTGRVSSGQLDAMLGAETFEMIDSVSDVAWQDRQAEARVALRSPMLLLAFVVFMLEQILGNRFYRTGATSTRSSSLSKKAAA